MKNLKSIVVAFVLIVALCPTGAKGLPDDYHNFYEWAQACRDERLQVKTGSYSTPLNSEIFNKTFEKFMEVIGRSSLSNKANWFEGRGPEPEYFEPKATVIKKWKLSEKQWGDKFSARDNLFV